MTPDPQRTQALLQAYRDTRYEVLDGGELIVARIGERSAALDALLQRHGVQEGSFLTAWNPASEARSLEENTRAHHRLLDTLAHRGQRHLPHTGRSEDLNWSEEGVFLLGGSLQDAVALAVDFGQYALVHVASGEPPRLVPTRLLDAGA